MLRDEQGDRKLLHLVHMCSYVLIPYDDEELIQTAAVLQKRLRAALTVAKTFQVPLLDRKGKV